MREESKHWFEQSKHDLKAAQYNFDGDILDVASYLCQQSIEKGLKSLIIEKNREAPGVSHSLIKLGKEVEIPSKYYRILKEISQEYFISRYPDAIGYTPYDTYDKQEVKEIIKNTKEIIKWIENQIKKL